MPRNWTGHTDGTPWMQRTLVHAFRYAPRWLIYAVTAVVSFFYVPCRSYSRRAQMRFFRYCFHLNRWQALRYTIRNHYEFGKVVMDRFAAYAGRTFRIVFDDKDAFDRLCDETNFILLSSHMGNFEMAGYALRPHRHICAVSFAGETQVVMQQRQQQFTVNGISLIPVVEGDMSHVIAIHNALERGDIVSVPGDRMFASERSVAGTLFGYPVRVPEGPFRLARLTGKQIISMWVMKEDRDTYRIYTALVSTPQQYLDHIQTLLMRYPTQYYQYFDFMDYDTPTSAA